MRHKRSPSTVARVNGRQRLAQVNRRQAQHKLIRARVEGATVAQPKPDMAQRPAARTL